MVNSEKVIHLSEITLIITHYCSLGLSWRLKRIWLPISVSLFYRFNQVCGKLATITVDYLSPVHTGDYSRWIPRLSPKLAVAEFGDCRQKRRLFVAEFGDYSRQCGQGIKHGHHSLRPSEYGTGVTTVPYSLGLSVHCLIMKFFNTSRACWQQPHTTERIVCLQRSIT